MSKKFIAAILLTTTVFSAATAHADSDRWRGKHRDRDRDSVQIIINDNDNYRYKRYSDPYPRGYKHKKKWHDNGHHKGHYKGKKYYDNRDVYIINPPVKYYAPPVRYYNPPAYNYSAPVSTVSCYDSPNMAGQILGGVGGGVLGYQIGKGHGKTAAVIGGTLLGSMLGNQLTSYDRNCSHQVFEYAQPGTQVAWSNPHNNYNYTVVPSQPYEVQGRYCREYQGTSTIGGRYQETYGTACRQPDGDWEIVK